LLLFVSKFQLKFSISDGTALILYTPSQLVAPIDMPVTTKITAALHDHAATITALN